MPEEYGHSCSRDVVRKNIRWLEEQGLLTVEEVGKTLVAKLTGRGDGTATGCRGGWRQETASGVRWHEYRDPGLG